MTLARNNTGTLGPTSTASPSWAHNADGAANSWLLAILGLLGTSYVNATPTFDGEALTKLWWIQSNGDLFSYAKKAPNAGSHNVAMSLNAADYVSGVSVDYLDSEGPIQWISEGGSLGTSYQNTRALRDTRATSKVLCVVVSRQNTISENTGSTVLYQSNHLEVSLGVFEKAGGGDVYFSIKNSTYGRDYAAILIEVGESFPLAPFARHTHQPLDYSTASSISWPHNSAGRQLMSLLGHRSGSSPSGSQTYGGVAMSLEDSVSDSSDMYAKLYSLEQPATGLNSVAHPMSAGGNVDGISLDLVGTSGIRQIVSGDSSLGGLHTAARTTTPLTNTKASSLCYCFVMSRQNILSETSGDGDLVTLYQSVNHLENAVALFQKDGNGGSQDFTIYADSYDRNYCWISFEVGQAAAGNQVMWVMMERMRRFYDELKAGLIPAPELQRRYQEAMQI